MYGTLKAQRDLTGNIYLSSFYTTFRYLTLKENTFVC